MSLLLATKIEAFDLKSIFANFKTQWYFYAVFLFIVVILFVGRFFYKRQERIILDKTQRIAITATLTALCVVANIYSFGDDNNKISLVIVTCFIAGYLLGGSIGFTVGFVGDLLACIIAPQGVYNPIISLSSSLWGFIPGFIFFHFKGEKHVLSYLSLAVSLLICYPLNTLGIYLMYSSLAAKYTFISYLGIRFPISIANFAVNLTIAVLLLPTLERIKVRLRQRYTASNVIE